MLEDYEDSYYFIPRNFYTLFILFYLNRIGDTVLKLQGVSVLVFHFQVISNKIGVGFTDDIY